MRKAVSVAIPCSVGWTFTYFATNIFSDYAPGLFLWLPVVMAVLTTLLYAYNNVVKRTQLRNLSYLTLGVYCLGLVAFAWEGVICLIMAAPLGILFTYIGYRIGYLVIKSKIAKNSATVMILLLLSLPACLAFEESVKGEESLRSITTSVVINAPPEVVWENVIRFPQIKSPTELLFKAGIAYPISARIEGQGVGAIRYCNFSTGSFVEPITIWDEPRLLRFSVVEQPEPLKELSFYDIHPSHLHGSWLSEQGQFKLTRLPNGRVLLEGTTWYINKIKPEFYWTWWSDLIVHKIHERVLQHIKEQAEAVKPSGL